MARRAGNAELPLHGGRVPKWLGDRMTRLGAMITQAIILEDAVPGSAPRSILLAAGATLSSIEEAGFLALDGAGASASFADQAEEGEACAEQS